LLPRGDDDDADNVDGFARRQHGPYRRWRDCTPDRRQCGPWQTGPAPEEDNDDDDLPSERR
jgi:hypothetical protein